LLYKHDLCCLISVKGGDIINVLQDMTRQDFIYTSPQLTFNIEVYKLSRK